MARQLFSPEQRRRHVEQWQQSGLSQRAYCQQQGIKQSTFKNWIDRNTGRETPAFAPVTLTEFNATPVVIVTPDGFRIEIPVGSNHEQLDQLFQALGITHAR